MNTRLCLLAATLRQGEAALLVSPSNRLYYTGFDSDAGVLWVTKDEACFLTDSRYTEAARRVIGTLSCHQTNAFLTDAIAQLKERGVKTVLVEEDTLHLAQYRRLRKLAGDIDYVTDSTLCRRVREQRRTKDEHEIACIRRAQAVTEAGFDFILPHIAVGRREKDIALELEMFMRRNGADRVAFDFIVAAGANGALPHAVPGEYTVQSGDFVTLDFGATVDGYRSDMTRTVAVGEPTAEQRRVYDTVLKAQKACLDGLYVGMRCEAGDALARRVIDEAGYGAAFGHSTGHGVGIDIHEYPNLSPRSDECLREGDVVTVEPGIYLEGRFGVRIEDMVWFTSDGVVNLTDCPKDLIIL